MPKSHEVEVKCPKCLQVRLQSGNSPKVCYPCREKVYKNKRLDTMRRPGRHPYCDICVEKAKFEYFLRPPPSVRRNNGRGPEWVVMCDLCFNTWLESGEHRISTVQPEVWIGSKGRPLTQDERDAFDAGKRMTRDRSTGLLTNEWRRR